MRDVREGLHRACVWLLLQAEAYRFRLTFCLQMVERTFCFGCIYCHNIVIFVRAGGGIGPRLLSVKDLISD